MHRLYCFQKFAKLTTVSKNSVKESGLVLLGKISWKIIKKKFSTWNACSPRRYQILSALATPCFYMLFIYFLIAAVEPLLKNLLQILDGFSNM